jgi:hypothetical protein
MGAWWWPKSQPLSINRSFYTGYYRGLGIRDDASYLGKQFYRLVVKDGPYGFWEVDYARPGYNPYRGYYPDGTCREVGECLVEWNGGSGDPAPDNHDVRSGKYFRPDGTLASEVVNGTGTQTLWYPDGRKRWELVLEKYQRRRHSMWYEGGQLRQTQQYVNGNVDGEFQTFHENGVIKLSGAYAEGRRVGVWTTCDEGGKVMSVENYAAAPLNSTSSSGDGE